MSGYLTLADSELGVLDMTCLTGFVVANFQLGYPATREAMRNRAMADGTVDDTRYVGARAITATIRLDQRVAPMQSLVDLLLPFMAPRRRTTLTYSLPGSDDDRRQFTVRPVAAPVEVKGPKFQTIVLQWVTVGSPYAQNDTLHTETFQPGSASEGGRSYDLTFDRTYPASLPVGSFLCHNDGTAPADWVATIFGPITGPTLTVNGVAVALTQNGGVTLTAGQTVVIDTAARSILFGGDPDESRYDKANFSAWAWDDILFRPGDNTVRFTGTGDGTGTAVTVAWRDAWW